MKKVPYSLTYKGQKYNFNYLRNYNGFRGEEIDLNKIKAVFIGGSTADERWKPEEHTIVGIINKKLKKDNIEIKITNAAIEGQSTLGHLTSFSKWFPKLKDFKPKYFIFYVGINDHLRKKFETGEIDDSDGHMKSEGKDFLIDTIKSNSFFYDSLRKIKYKYYNKDKQIIYDFDYAIKNYIKKDSKYQYMSYDQAIKTYDLNKILINNKKNINYYLNNIDKLHDKVKKYDAIPIFINQVMSDGSALKTLFALNFSLIQHCKLKNYNCINLAKKLNGVQEYWFDGIHTTHEGSKKISELIYPELKSFLLKKN